MKIDKLLKTIFFASVLLGLFACSDTQESDEASIYTVKNSSKALTTRWYDSSNVSLGKSVYEANCKSCHLQDAKGTQDWKKTMSDDSYPPPPLNGTAHAWHHSINVLLTVINDGGIPNGGKMPAFKNSLSQDQKLSVIAYVQSFWTDEIYSKWEAIHK
tara:strand:+ start:1387 stop:1860 length:474 start_codon:yes stop_codon:yes gene_type:complete